MCMVPKLKLSAYPTRQPQPSLFLWVHFLIMNGPNATEHVHLAEKWHYESESQRKLRLLHVGDDIFIYVLISFKTLISLKWNPLFIRKFPHKLQVPFFCWIKKKFLVDSLTSSHEIVELLSWAKCICSRVIIQTVQLLLNIMWSVCAAVS